MSGFRAFVRAQNGSTVSPTTAADASPAPTPLSPEQRRQQNLAVVDAAIAKYEAEGLYDAVSPAEEDEDDVQDNELDLCSFWSVRASVPFYLTSTHFALGQEVRTPSYVSPRRRRTARTGLFCS